MLYVQADHSHVA
jgi:hypothetical protein